MLEHRVVFQPSLTWTSPAHQLHLVVACQFSTVLGTNRTASSDCLPRLEGIKQERKSGLAAFHRRLEAGRSNTFSEPATRGARLLARLPSSSVTTQAALPTGDAHGRQLSFTPLALTMKTALKYSQICQYDHFNEFFHTHTHKSTVQGSDGQSACFRRVLVFICSGI